MYLTKEVKKKSSLNTEEKQKTLVLQKVKKLCLHQNCTPNRTLEKNRHDYNTERSVLLVGKRRSL
jgi:small subunit ribosomal protein S15